MTAEGGRRVTFVFVSTVREIGTLTATFLPLKSAFIVAEQRVPSFLEVLFPFATPNVVGLAMVLLAGVSAATAWLMTSVSGRLWHKNRVESLAGISVGSEREHVTALERTTSKVLITILLAIGFMTSAPQAGMTLLGFGAVISWELRQSSDQPCVNRRKRLATQVRRSSSWIAISAAVIASFLTPPLGVTGVLIVVVASRRGLQIGSTLLVMPDHTAGRRSAKTRLPVVAQQTFNRDVILYLPTLQGFGGRNAGVTQTHTAHTENTATLSVFDKWGGEITRLYPKAHQVQYRSELKLHQLFAASEPGHMVGIDHEARGGLLIVKLKWANADTRVSATGITEWEALDALMSLERWSHTEGQLSVHKASHTHQRFSKVRAQLSQLAALPGEHQTNLGQVSEMMSDIEQICSGGPMVLALRGTKQRQRFIKIDGLGTVLADAGGHSVEPLGTKWRLTRDGPHALTKTALRCGWNTDEIQTALIRSAFAELEKAIALRDFRGATEHSYRLLQEIDKLR